MEDQKEFFHFVETLHAENDKHNQVIGYGVYFYSFKFNPNISQEFYEGTRTAIDDVVLRPWTYLFSQQKDFSELPHDIELRKGIWSLCYDRFEHNLKDWTKLAKPKPTGIAYNDKLKLPIKTSDGRLNEFWRDSISYDDFVKKVVGHSFLLSADNRMSLYDDYDCKRTDENIKQRVKLVLASSEFDTFKSWNNVFLASTGTTNVDNFMSGVYNYGKYSGDVEDLLRYLRNLKHHYHQHGLAAGSMVDVDRGVSKHFGGFLELLYKNLEV
ncbi:hypothetical protein ACE6H2_008423 [Prunus campanulata]